MFLNEREFKIALARKGLPAIAIAKAVGVHQETLSRWVRGWVPVPEKFGQPIANLLGVTEKQLFQKERK